MLICALLFVTFEIIFVAMRASHGNAIVCIHSNPCRFRGRKENFQKFSAVNLCFY